MDQCILSFVSFLQVSIFLHIGNIYSNVLRLEIHSLVWHISSICLRLFLVQARLFWGLSCNVRGDFQTRCRVLKYIYATAGLETCSRPAPKRPQQVQHRTREVCRGPFQPQSTTHPPEDKRPTHPQQPRGHSCFYHDNKSQGMTKTTTQSCKPKAYDNFSQEIPCANFASS